MSSTLVLGFIKDITARNTKAVHDRLNAVPPQGPNQRYTDPKEQNLTYTLLHKAVEVDSPDIASALLTAGADVNAQDSRGRTPLHWLAGSRSKHATASAELLLQHPAINIHASSSSGATPLHTAAAAGNLPMLQLLLKHGAAPGSTSQCFTALHAACMGSCSPPPAATTSRSCSSTPVQNPEPQLTDPTTDDSELVQQDSVCLSEPAPQQPNTSRAPSRPGELKPVRPAAPAATKTQQPRPIPPQVQHGRAPTGSPARPAPAARSTVGAACTAAAEAAGPAARRTGVTSRDAAAAKTAAAARATPQPTKAPSQPTLQATALGAPAAARLPAASPRPTVEVLDVLLAAAPEQLRIQDAQGFTPLMRLVQRGGCGPEALALLARGDCNLSAQAVSGDTALHLACSSTPLDLQLVSAMVAAGASPTQPRSSDGNTPLLLATKLGGEAGLALARALLQHSRFCAGAQQQQQQEQREGASAVRWCPLDADGVSDDSSSGPCISGSVDTANAAGETAVGVAAAAVLDALPQQPGAAAVAGTTAGAASSRAAGTAGPSAAQEELLGLLLSCRPELPQETAVALLQEGLAGRLSDRLTLQVVACLPDMPSLTAAAAKASAATRTSQPTLPSLGFEGLLSVRMYRTAVAWLSKSSGKPAAAERDAAGNTLLHNAVSGSEDLPEFVAALVEAGVPVDAANSEHDTALHIAARQGHLQSCQALLAAGADVLRRNGKNRAPGAQLKLPEAVKAFLKQAEEAARMAKEEQRHELWDEKMRATQTQSAYGIRVT